MVSVATIRYSHTVGCYALKGPGFLNPVDVALDSDQVIYVLSRGHGEGEYGFTKRITMCNMAGDYLGEFGRAGNQDGGFVWPASIAMDKDDHLYISDEALQRISILDKKGEFISKWGTQGSGEGEFNRPTGITFDKDGNLLVVDGMNHRIQRYTKDGKYLGGWGSQGTGNGQFNFPWGITTDQAGNAYVADWRNDRIQKFDGDGKFLTAWGASGDKDGQFNRPSGMAVDKEGYIYVADRGNERMQVLDPDGKFIAKFRGEAGWSKWAEEWFNSANQDLLEEWQNANLEPELDPVYSGLLGYESGSTIKLFWAPSSIKIDPDGKIIVLETLRHRIQVYIKG